MTVAVETPALKWGDPKPEKQKGKKEKQVTLCILCGSPCYGCKPRVMQGKPVIPVPHPHFCKFHSHGPMRICDCDSCLVHYVEEKEKFDAAIAAFKEQNAKN